MDTLEQGFMVKDVRGRRAGRIALVRKCCVQLEADGFCLKREAIVAVQQSQVEIICDANQMPRYECPTHSAGRESNVGSPADSTA